MFPTLGSWEARSLAPPGKEAEIWAAEARCAFRAAQRWCWEPVLHVGVLPPWVWWAASRAPLTDCFSPAADPLRIFLQLVPPSPVWPVPASSLRKWPQLSSVGHLSPSGSPWQTDQGVLTVRMVCPWLQAVLGVIAGQQHRRRPSTHAHGRMPVSILLVPTDPKGGWKLLWGRAGRWCWAKEQPPQFFNTKSSRWAVSFPQASMDRDCKGPQRPCPFLSRLALCGPVRAGLISLIVNHRPATSAPAKEVEGSSAFPLIKCLRPCMLTRCWFLGGRRRRDIHVWTSQKACEQTACWDQRIQSCSKEICTLIVV